MKKSNIVFVAGLHGNEQMPVRALTKNNIPFIIGNLRAKKKNVRFIDNDLNASFGLRARGYEPQRAKQILKQIKTKDLVVDFHTTTAKITPFVIIVDKKMLKLAASTGLKKVVFMKHNIKNKHALINYRQGISVETGNHNSKKSFDTTLRVVKNVKNQKRYDVEVYEVYDKILKTGIYKNFKKHRDGFFPVLAGEKAYNFYGLKAKKILNA